MSSKEKLKEEQVAIRLSSVSTMPELKEELKELRENLGDDYPKVIKSVTSKNRHIAYKIDSLPGNPYK